MTAELVDDRPRVLVVDDEAPLRELIVVTLGDEFQCEEVSDGEAALAQQRIDAAQVGLIARRLGGRQADGDGEQEQQRKVAHRGAPKVGAMSAD